MSFKTREKGLLSMKNTVLIETGKEINWLKDQVSSLQKSIATLSLKLACSQAECESYKEMVKRKHKVEYEEFKKEW